MAKAPGVHGENAEGRKFKITVWTESEGQREGGRLLNRLLKNVANYKM